MERFTPEAEKSALALRAHTVTAEKQIFIDRSLEQQMDIKHGRK